MQFTIPFTNFKIQTGNDPQTSASRGRAYGAFSDHPDKDRSGVKISSDSLFTAWRNSADVFACVREIVETCGIGGFRWVNPKDENWDEEASPQVVKEVEDVFGYYYQDGIHGFKEHALEQRLVSGQFYTEKVPAAIGGKIIGVRGLDARTMGIVTDSHGNVYNYIQVSPFDAYGSEPVVFDPSEIIHWKNGRDPNNENFGFAPMEPVLWEVRADMSAMVGNYFLQENSAVPAVQYIMDPELDENQVKAAIELIKQQFKGSRKKGKSGAIWGVKEIKQLQMSPKDMEFLSLRRFTTEKICAAFGVPKAILGYTEGMTFNNQEGQMKKFYEGTVRKYEIAFENLINKEIIEKTLGLQDRIKFKIQPASFDTEETLARRAIDLREAGLITINEGRGLIGDDPIDESLHSNFGDQVILGSGNSAVMLIDVGADPSDPDALEKLTKAVKELDSLNKNDEQ